MAVGIIDLLEVINITEDQAGLFFPTWRFQAGDYMRVSARRL